MSSASSVPEPRVHAPEVRERLGADRSSPLDKRDPDDVQPGAHVAPGMTPDATNVFETPHQCCRDEVAKGQVAPGDDALVHPLPPQLRRVAKPSLSGFLVLDGDA